MKKTLLTLALILSFASQMFAMSMSNMRNSARFLSDRMAYELELTPMQYDDCYEINYDFMYAINDLMDDVVYGYGDAIDRYYSLLDYRNEDLRYVLNAHQYARFIALEYFYRPIHTIGRNWALRIYSIYRNHTHFYYDVPSVFYSYRGAHSHMHYHNDYYMHRHHHPEIHRAPAHIHGTPHMHDHGRHDFGNVRRERPQGGSRPGGVRPQGGARHEGGARPQMGGSSRPQQNARPQRENNHSRHERSNSGAGTRGGNNGGSRPQGNRGGENRREHQSGSRGGRR